MAELIKAREPFRFYTRIHLSELIGLRATTLGQLLAIIKKVPGSCIYHHTHRFLQQHQFLSPEPPNDFAYWVSEILGEDELGERLASVDTIQFSTIHALREKIIETIESYLKEHRLSHLRFSHDGEEFYFMKSVSFIIPTPYQVYDLVAFSEVMRKVAIDSIYFHVFEARLRLEKKTNDFSNWIATSLGDEDLAEDIANFDPYTRTLEDLRNTIIDIVKRRIPT